jgi:hypothetical protein
MVDERYCRGDWSEPKSKASNAAVPVQRHVLERIHALKLKTVYVRAGRAVRKYKAVKSDGPNDLVFQSVRDGKAMLTTTFSSGSSNQPPERSGAGLCELALDWNCGAAAWCWTSGARKDHAVAG